jgi:predicted DNA-binding transcriptional regulator AlpA
MNLLTARETAALLRCSVRQLHRLQKRADFPRRYTIGRSLRWDAADLDAWLRDTARATDARATDAAQTDGTEQTARATQTDGSAA